MKFKVVNTVYRSIIVKRNRKKEVKAGCKEEEKPEIEVIEVESDKEPDMF